MKTTRQSLLRHSRLLLLLLSSPLVSLVIRNFTLPQVEAFQQQQSIRSYHQLGIQQQHHRLPFAGRLESSLYAATKDASKEPSSSSSTVREDSDDDELTTAATGTVNQRLLAELQEAKEREKTGSRSSKSAQAAATIFGSLRKTDEERAVAIAEARDLNGVNPVTALVGSAVALGGAFCFWQLTQFLAEYFALHPTSDDQIYFVARLSAVARNIAIGLAALASGFFGVTGVGILSLGVRVAYGVVTGELDPTPKVKDETKMDRKVEMEEIWKLMTNQSKKRGQR